MTRIYADHAATTVVRAEVAERMLDVMRNSGANPSSLHAEGRRARAVLDDSRERVARVLGAEPSEIVFTGGGSEADTLAIRGAAFASRATRGIPRPHVVTVATEHHAVLHAVEALADDGFDTTVLPVEADGRVAPERFARALDPERTVLATVMLANNELGTVQPVTALAALAAAAGVRFHTDAVQAPGRLALDVRALGVDLLSLSAHKFYGPKGVGVLYVRDGVAVAPQILGGGQERGRRSGTENVAGAAGLALALELAERERPLEAARLAVLRDRLEDELSAAIPELVYTARAPERLPNLTSVALPRLPADLVLAALDLEGAAVSTGSACAAGAVEPSHVLRAIGLPDDVARRVVRISLGRSNDLPGVLGLARLLAKVVAGP